MTYYGLTFKNEATGLTIDNINNTSYFKKETEIKVSDVKNMTNIKFNNDFDDEFNDEMNKIINDGVEELMNEKAYIDPITGKVIEGWNPISAIKNAVNKAINFAKKFIMDIYNKAVKAITGFFEDVRDKIVGAFKSFFRIFEKMITKAVKKVQRFFEKIFGVIKDVVENLGNFISILATLFICSQIYEMFKID